MLVLSRRIDEKIMIGTNVIIQIVEIQGDKVRIGIDAPAAVEVDREEIRLQRLAKAQQETREF